METDVAPSVVSINATSSGAGYGGTTTGIITSPSGLVVTESGFVNGATSITASVMSSGESYKATVVGSDPRQGITVLHLLGASGLQPIHIESSADVTSGTKCVSLGAASDNGTFQEAHGTITALDKTVLLTGVFNDTLRGVLQTNAPMSESFEGGPLVTTTGKIIGMNLTASLEGNNGYVIDSTNTGFALPMNRVLITAKTIANKAGLS